MHLADDQGNELDAEYSVELDGRYLALIMNSRGGEGPGHTGRNHDYNLALTILLSRLGMLNAFLEDALVDSRWTQRRGLPERERRIIDEPIRLPKDKTSANALRIRMARAQALVAANPGTAKAGGTKKIRLRLSIPRYQVNAGDAERLERTLAEPVHDADIQEIRYSPVEIAEAAIEDAAGNPGTSGRGQGFQLDQDVKDAVEAFAMNTATQFYREAGWQVEDVHGSRSYDLICSKDGVSTHVEVKGTTGDGTEVILTYNEVEHARNYSPVALFIVSKIVVQREETGAVVIAGGEIRQCDPWIISDGTLKAIGYKYRVPASCSNS
jgi:hypothetical protein